MQTDILRALALVAVGNAALRGREIAGFWPDDEIFRYSKVCDFRVVDDTGDRLLAPDPLAWFASLRGTCSGLRLHNAPRSRGRGQSILAEERMLVGFVGGGPAWLIEAVDVERSQLWLGFDRLGDRDDPQRKIWLNTYLLQGETAPQHFSAAPLRIVGQTLGAVLTEIETLARKLEAENFAECFRSARRTLEGKDDAALAPWADFTRYADFDLEQRRLLQAVLSAWVFGGMGSWNDLGAPPEFAGDYDRLSEQLFRALCDGVCALANSTYAAGLS